jgi:hypothetical protein
MRHSTGNSRKRIDKSMKLQNDATERNLFKEHVVKDNWKDNRVDFVVKTVEIFRYKMILGQIFQLDL